MPANWGIVSKLLEGADADTPLIGTIWLFLLFGRIMVHGFAADDVFNDEARFRCRTDVVDCTQRCFDDAFPFSPGRLWTLQLICVALPALVYIGFVMHVTHKEKKMRDQEDKLREQLRKAQAECKLRQQEKRLREQLANPSPTIDTSKEKLREQLHDMQDELKQRKQLDNLLRLLRRPRFTDKNGNVKIQGKVLFTYLTSLLLRILLEVVTIYIQYHLYGGQGESYLNMFLLDYKYRCNPRNDQSHQCQAPVDCYMPRPTEKTWTLRYMGALAGASVLLSVVDMLYQIFKSCFKSCKRRSNDMEAMETAAEEDLDIQPGSNASYNVAMMENRDHSIILHMENMQQRSSISGGLDGDGGAAATTLTHHKPQPSYYC